MSTDIALAEKLLSIDAVRLSPSKPFTWSGGWKSPIYCDNRKALSFPEVRDFIRDELCRIITESFSNSQLIAGVATAGIAWGALVADKLKLPYIYVRPKPKEHGLGNQVEGHYEPGKNVLIVEDLISTAKSSLLVASVLTSCDLKVTGIVSIFDYGFNTAKEALTEADIPHKSISNYEALINVALDKRLVTANDENSLLNWRADPANWKQVS